MGSGLGSRGDRVYDDWTDCFGEGVCKCVTPNLTYLYSSAIKEAAGLASTLDVQLNRTTHDVRCKTPQCQLLVCPSFKQALAMADEHPFKALRVENHDESESVLLARVLELDSEHAAVHVRRILLDLLLWKRLERLPPDLLHLVARAMGRPCRQLCKLMLGAYGPLDCTLAPKGALLAQLSHPTRLQLIRRLDLRSVATHVDERLLQQLPSSFRNLRSLDLSGCYVTASGLASLAPLGACLTELSLRYCSPSSWGLLATSLPVLSSLRALMLPALYTSCPPAAAQQLYMQLEHLQLLPHLSRLEVGSRGINAERTMCHGDLLVAAIARLPSLMSCELPPLAIKDVTLATLALLQPLRHLCLQVLDSDDRHGDGQACRAMMQGLTSLTNLESLYLDREACLAKSMGAAWAGFVNSTQLTSLTLVETARGSFGCTVMMAAVGSMHRLRTLKLVVDYMLSQRCLQHLTSLAGCLTSLELRARIIPGTALWQLRGLCSLALTCNTAQKPVTAGDLHGISSLTRLQRLHMNPAPIGDSDSVFQAISCLTTLTALDLKFGWHKACSVEQLACLGQLQGLQTLTMAGELKVPDGGWGFVQGLCSLRELALERVGLARFCEMLPVPPQLTKLRWRTGDLGLATSGVIGALMRQHVAVVELPHGIYP